MSHKRRLRDPVQGRAGGKLWASLAPALRPLPQALVRRVILLKGSRQGRRGSEANHPSIRQLPSLFFNVHHMTFLNLIFISC